MSELLLFVSWNAQALHNILHKVPPVLWAVCQDVTSAIWNDCKIVHFSKQTTLFTLSFSLICFIFDYVERTCIYCLFTALERFPPSYEWSRLSTFKLVSLQWHKWEFFYLCMCCIATMRLVREVLFKLNKSLDVFLVWLFICIRLFLFSVWGGGFRELWRLIYENDMAVWSPKKSFWIVKIKFHKMFYFI